VYLGLDDDPEDMIVCDLPGWLILHDDDVQGLVVCAGDVDEFGYVHPAGEAYNFWMVVGPTDALPTAERAQAERASRQRERANRGAA